GLIVLTGSPPDVKPGEAAASQSMLPIMLAPATNVPVVVPAADCFSHEWTCERPRSYINHFRSSRCFWKVAITRSSSGAEDVRGIDGDVPDLRVGVRLRRPEVADRPQISVEHIACTQAIMLENPARLLDEGEIEEPVLLDRLAVQEPHGVVRAVDVDQEVPPVVLKHLEAAVELQVREALLRDKQLEVAVPGVEAPDQ